MNNFVGSNVGGIADIKDTGYQLQSSMMLVQKTLQGYLSGSQIFSDYGDSSDIRAGVNWYFMKERGLRVNGEWIHLNKSPVGYTAVPVSGRRQRQPVPHQSRDEFLGFRLQATGYRAGQGLRSSSCLVPVSCLAQP